jgi:hypothetical protein
VVGGVDVLLANAYDSFAAFVLACRNGYKPTLKTTPADDLPTRCAKRVLVHELSTLGFEIYLG